jgi:uncharacterized membrane protein YdjX (TVP38/TMEM64 family)
MIGAYIALASYLQRIPALETALDDLARQGGVLGITVLWLVLFASLTLPFSSAALFIVLGIDLFGATPVFWTALTAGLAATATTYAVGRGLTGSIRWRRLREPIEEARGYLASRVRTVGVLTFAIKLVPNPLYDAWGYACGALRVPFRTYFPAAVAGGLVPLCVLCFGLGRFL